MKHIYAAYITKNDGDPNKTNLTAEDDAHAVRLLASMAARWAEANGSVHAWVELQEGSLYECEFKARTRRLEEVL
jgi:hypothetical protein